MSLDEFDRAESHGGHTYELSRGTITVVDVPSPRHFRQVNAIRKQFAAYDVAHPGKIYAIASGGECKILVSELDSERHPDLAVYMSPPPDEEDAWSTWIPQIVIEVVSPGSEQRDYDEKRDEYLRFGVVEYWIVDEQQGRTLVLRRSRGKWVEKVVHPPELYATRLLPGFTLDCGAVFAAAAGKP
jgi:Uma2 family endonuclease